LASSSRACALWLDEAALKRRRDGLRASVDAELRVNVLDVRGDRLRADDECRGDLSLGAALREQRQDLSLAGAQARLVGVPVPVAVRLRWSCPAQRAPDPREQLSRVERLRKIVVGTEHQPGGAIEGVRPVRRDEDHGKISAEALVELAHDLQAVDGTFQLDLDDGQRGALAALPLEQLVRARRRAGVVAEAHGSLHRGDA
jgi:hypothetical protein